MFQKGEIALSCVALDCRNRKGYACSVRGYTPPTLLCPWILFFIHDVLV
jgi:hypothetical protein